MRVAYIGNFEPEHSTENEIQRALLNNGHEVVIGQEGNSTDLMRLIDMLQNWRYGEPFDLVMWTRTASLAAKSGPALYWQMMATARQAKVPVVGYHLDRWWGLARQTEIELDPYFRVDLLATADGGHDEQWEKVGVNHVWLPPAVSERHCHLGTPRPEYTSDLAFVGSWLPGYHEEWGHRSRLVRWLKHNYDRRIAFYPKRGEHAIRGDALTDLYASVKVVVGDSCLVPRADGSPMINYASDRIPECLGRGAVLLHPSVQGIDDLYWWFHPWRLDDWEDLRRVIETTLAMKPEETAAWRVSASQHIREHHTYEIRVRELIALLNERGML